ncbi:hypothetical protein CZ771_14020 [Actinomycetales bacterium JB111]|nr:hypothetical protein CZ771_14020 [Actinomycetales bacterium JB111]
MVDGHRPGPAGAGRGRGRRHAERGTVLLHRHRGAKMRW